jgi:putative endonuclease
MYTVYILQSLKDNRYYIGSTNNLKRRFIEHNRGQTRSTANRKPFKLIYKEEYNNSKDA